MVTTSRMKNPVYFMSMWKVKILESYTQNWIICVKSFYFTIFYDLTSYAIQNNICQTRHCNIGTYDLQYEQRINYEKWRLVIWVFILFFLL